MAQLDSLLQAGIISMRLNCQCFDVKQRPIPLRFARHNRKVGNQMAAERKFGIGQHCRQRLRAIGFDLERKPVARALKGHARPGPFAR